MEYQRVERDAEGQPQRADGVLHHVVGDVGVDASLLDRVAADHEKISTDNLGRRRLSRTDVIDAYARQTGLPARRFSEKSLFRRTSS